MAIINTPHTPIFPLPSRFIDRSNFPRKHTETPRKNFPFSLTWETHNPLEERRREPSRPIWEFGFILFIRYFISVFLSFFDFVFFLQSLVKIRVRVVWLEIFSFLFVCPGFLPCVGFLPSSFVYALCFTVIVI